MNTFESKLNNMMKETMMNWWNNLSKQELLDYIAAQDGITADDIRGLFVNMNSSLEMGIEYNPIDNSTIVDFGAGDETE